MTSHATGILGRALLLAALLLAAPLLTTGAALADDWEDARRAALEEAVRQWAGETTVEAAPTGTTRRVVDEKVAFRHGDVRFTEDLARVEVILEIRNDEAAPIEWQRAFEMDPLAEAIGATIQRGRAAPVPAQTLTVAAAQRLYGEIRTPRRRTRTMPGTRGKDPLRVERGADDRLTLHVWPIAPGETVRVGLTFVTPLRGRGTRRTYVDPLQADLGRMEFRNGRVRAVPTAPDRAAPTSHMFTLDSAWVIRAGDLVPDGAPTGMVAAGAAGDALRFVGSRQDERAPTLPLRAPQETHEVLTVPGGGFGGRLAVWRFDPIAFLEEHGLHVPADATFRLLRRRGSTHHIAPWTFGVRSEPLPITARVMTSSSALRYAVEISTASGDVLHLVEVDRPLRRTRMDAESTGTVTGWHRAALARRVLAWAGDSPADVRDALDYAVDVGVLVPGTAALAIPRRDRRLLNARSRREYLEAGAPLGAQRREADLKRPPVGSVRR